MSTDGWFGSLLVGGGEVSWGVGGVGVRMLVRMLGIWEEGGGVMEDVARGAGDVNLRRSGEAPFAMSRWATDSERDADRPLGVSGAASSVVGMSESCDGWCRGVWLSILPEAQTVQAMRNTLRVRGAGRAISVVQSQCARNARNAWKQDMKWVVQDARTGGLRMAGERVLSVEWSRRVMRR
jgi:hypothetical protein